MPALGNWQKRVKPYLQVEDIMTNPGANERPYDAQPVDETEAERVAREQQEVQAAAGDTTETRNAGSMDAQNTPGPETQNR